VEIGGRAIALECGTAATETVLRLRNRSTGDDVDIPTEMVREVAESAGKGHVVRARFDLDGYPNGVWDAYIVQRFGDDEIISRFGAQKADGVGEDPIYLFSGGTESRTIGKLYFTQAVGNISVDLGFTL